MQDHDGRAQGRPTKGWRDRCLGRALYPLVVLFQNVPKVALAPIFILWFGYGLIPKIGLILVIAFFPVTLSMLAVVFLKGSA